MAIDMLPELTGYHPLFCHHHGKEEHRERLEGEESRVGAAHTSALPEDSGD
jgi:hypothetical protein